MFAVPFAVSHSPLPLAEPFATPFAVALQCPLRLLYGTLQGTLKNNCEWRTARRIDVRYSMFAAPFSIRCAVSYLCFPMFSIQGSLFNLRRAVRHSPHLSPFARRLPFAAPFAIRLVIRCAVRHSPRHFLFIFHNFRYSNFAIQCSPRR